MEGVSNITAGIFNETTTEAVNTGSNTTVSSVLRFEDYPRDALTTGFVFLVLMVIFGVLANAVSMLALVKSSKLHNATTALIVNLCFSDLLFSSTSTPFAVTVFWHGGWVYSHPLCVTYGISRFFNVGASVFTVIAITINRYVVIVKPMQYKRIFSPGNNLLVVTATWIITTLLIIPTAAGAWGRFAWDHDIGTCSVVPKNGKSSKAFLFMVAYFLPTLFFVVCYSRIYWIVRKTQKNLRQYSTNHKSAAYVANLLRRTGGQQQVSEERVQKHQRRTDKDLRLLKMIFVIFAVFTWCYLPLLLLKAFRLLDNYPSIQVLAYLNFYFSGCVNPIVYICMSREYRQAYRELFKGDGTTAPLSESTGSRETPM